MSKKHAERRAQDKKAFPNILIIMSDDQGPWAMRCAGTPELITPTIDRLAEEGMRFQNFFCASPVCSPARASFLTGRIPSQHGVLDWIRSGNIEDEEGVTWAGKDRPIEYLAGQTAFSDVLAVSGYVCGFCGKWHVGANGRPQKSHTYWCAHSLGGESYINYFAFDNRPEMTHQTKYVTDFYTDRALDFLEKYGQGPAPFCLSVHYTAPHEPWLRNEQPAEIWKLYDDCKFASLPVLPAHPWRGWNPTPEERRAAQQGYFTTITAMDAAIARLLSKLDSLGIAGETLVFFTSDNGFNLGHHGVAGKGNATFPLNMFEESVKVPFIARCPGRIRAGAINTGLVSQYDFMPTILDYLGLENPAAATLPGRSFARSLRGDQGGPDAVFVCDEYGPVRMIRERGWKYVHRYPYGPHELYGLAEDPQEKNNLVDDLRYSEILKRLRGKLEAWYLQYVDPARDGARQPVRGDGQIDFIGPDNRGRTALL